MLLFSLEFSYLPAIVELEVKTGPSLYSQSASLWFSLDSAAGVYPTLKSTLIWFVFAAFAAWLQWQLVLAATTAVSKKYPVHVTPWLGLPSPRVPHQLLQQHPRS
jgi:hypothetical protein